MKCIPEWLRKGFLQKNMRRKPDFLSLNPKPWQNAPQVRLIKQNAPQAAFFEQVLLGTLSCKYNM